MTEIVLKARNRQAQDGVHAVRERTQTVLGRSEATLLVVLGMCLVLFASSLFSMVLAVQASTYDMMESFFILAVEGVFFAVMLLIKYERSGIYLFEPFTIVTVVMVLLYYAAPLFRFATGSTDRCGVEVSPYCLEGTLLVMLGFFSFFMVYEFAGTQRVRRRSGSRERGVFFKEIAVDDARTLVAMAWVVWLVSYALLIYYYSSRGFGLIYILSGGLLGSSSEISTSSMDFLSNLKYTMLGAWMMIYAYGGNRGTKVLSFCLMVSCMLLAGGRVSLFVLLMAPVVYSYVRNKSTPRFTYTVLLLVAFVLLFAIVQIVRVGIRDGSGFSLEGYTLEELFEPFYFEIDDFKSYYALLAVIPEEHDFLYGSQMFLYTLVLFIPRVVWPDKPEPALWDIVELSLGSQAVESGLVYPAIGDYYSEFGVIGVIVCMAIAGYACRRLKNCYLCSEGSSLAIMTYAMVWALLLSFLIRFFSQNVAALVFMVAPILLFWLVLRVLNEKRASRTDDAEIHNRQCGGALR